MHNAPSEHAAGRATQWAEAAPAGAADVVSDRVYKGGNKQETHVRAGAER